MESNNERCAKNTDVEIWRGKSGVEWGDPDRFYADSLSIPAGNVEALSINCGGYVVTKPIREWHRLGMTAAPAPQPAPAVQLTDVQIQYMVKRFLGWRLPENFNPDAGISFKRDYNVDTPWPMKHEPTGTNLFDAMQAEQMIRYLIEGMSS